jgi:hypothetical protein
MYLQRGLATTVIVVFASIVGAQESGLRETSGRDRPDLIPDEVALEFLLRQLNHASAAPAVAADLEQKGLGPTAFVTLQRVARETSERHQQRDARAEAVVRDDRGRDPHSTKSKLEALRQERDEESKDVLAGLEARIGAHSNGIVRAYLNEYVKPRITIHEAADGEEVTR